MPNAKRQTPNAKRQTPNAKRLTPNAKRKSFETLLILILYLNSGLCQSCWEV
jgi:hypothetical protein